MENRAKQRVLECFLSNFISGHFVTLIKRGKSVKSKLPRWPFQMEIKTFTLYTHTRTHWNSTLKMNHRAYISASLRFLASTIISCNSTDTSSERIKRGGRGCLREEIKGKQRKLKEYNKALTDRNKGYTVSTAGSAARADKSFCNQRYSERQFALPVDPFFAPAIMMNHQRLYSTVSASC